jgi:pyruvate dehydrogenase (quinone)
MSYHDTFQEIAPLPPHVMKSQAKKAVRAWIKEPERAGIAARGFRQKLAEFYEMLPGRNNK